MEDFITTCISTNNNLEYLKLAIKSIRKNSYYKDQPVIIHAENCNDGTNEWLKSQCERDTNLKVYIETNEVPRGIGGGMDFCVDKAKTKFVNIIHSDMWISPNQDLELLKLYDGVDDSVRLIASSFRIQPKIFPNDPDYRPGTIFMPVNEFGEFYHNFDDEWFDEWSSEFSNSNDLSIRKGGGAGFFCRKEDYVWIGGNDPLFAPASFDDMDLFIRMQLEDYKFIMTSKSTVYHFSARGSHFKDDNITQKSERQIKAEQANVKKWISKWGKMPETDSETFVKPIYGTDNPTRIDLL